MTMDMVFTLIWSIAGAIMLVYYASRKHPLFSAFFGMFSGGGCLLLLYFYGEKIGMTLELNFFNTMISLILGIPGVFMMLLTGQFL